MILLGPEWLLSTRTKFCGIGKGREYRRIFKHGKLGCVKLMAHLNERVLLAWLLPIGVGGTQHGYLPCTELGGLQYNYLSQFSQRQ